MTSDNTAETASPLAPETESKPRAVSDALRNKIAQQSMTEIEAAARHKKGRLSSWREIESVLYQRKGRTDKPSKPKPGEERADVDLGKLREFEQTLLSKIDAPLFFKISHSKLSEKQRFELLDKLREIDAQRGLWDFKDLASKSQCVRYGRAVFAFHTAPNPYRAYLENVDAYDFLVDPECGGLSLEDAWHLGRRGIVKSVAEMEAGAKSGRYVKAAVKEIKDGVGGNYGRDGEQAAKDARTTDAQQSSTEPAETASRLRLTEWYTTYEGKRYYVLLHESSGKAIRCEPLEKLFPDGLWPFVSYASFPDLTEFWTPGNMEQVIDVLLAQKVSIDQMLDNSEAVNKPNKAYDPTKVTDPSQLRFRANGLTTVAVGEGRSINDYVATLDTPPIDAPLKVYQALEAIQEKASGVTSGAKGVAEEERVAIYEGNQAQAADRFRLLSRSYAAAYRALAALYYQGVRAHLSEQDAVALLGPDGVLLKTLPDRIDDAGITVSVESSVADTASSIAKQRAKDSFLASYVNAQFVNPKKLFELRGAVAGLTEQEIRELLDVEEYGPESATADAERDIEKVLRGEDVTPPVSANVAYLQRVKDYIERQGDEVDDDDLARLGELFAAASEYAVRNAARAAERARAERGMTAAEATAPEMAQEPQIAPEEPIQNVTPFNG